MSTFSFASQYVYLGFTEIFLGSMALLSFHALVPARWTKPLLPAARYSLRLRWPLLLLFALTGPIASRLYPWWRQAGDESLSFRSLYLNPLSFLLRGAVYWLLWLWLARALQKKKPWAGAGGLVLLFFTSTFASVDWIQSLDTEFYSTAFGLIFFLSACLLGFSVFLYAGAGSGDDRSRRDLGSVHLALICTWTYTAFMQFLVVWSGNLPDEMAWYQRRSREIWICFPLIFGLLQFFLPLLLLLQAPLKRSLRFTRGIALLTVFCQLSHLYWLLLPEAGLAFAENAVAGSAGLMLFAYVLLLPGDAHGPP